MSSICQYSGMCGMLSTQFSHFQISQNTLRRVLELPPQYHCATVD